MKVGAVEQVRGRMYGIPARFRVSPGVIEFGYGPFRMNPGAKSPPPWRKRLPRIVLRRTVIYFWHSL